MTFIDFQSSIRLMRTADFSDNDPLKFLLTLTNAKGVVLWQLSDTVSVCALIEEDKNGRNVYVYDGDKTFDSFIKLEQYVWEQTR